MFRWGMAVLVFTMIGASVFAQRTGSGGNANTPGAGLSLNQGATLTIRVAWQDDRPVEEVVHLQLLNSSGVPVSDTFTDNTATGRFSGLRQGTYRVHVTGLNIIETTSNNISVYRNDGTQMEVVRVTPRDPSGDRGSPGGMISAQEFNIPDKARKQMDKGMEFFDKGDMTAAEEWLRKAVETYPKYTRAWNNIGVIHIKANDQAGAIDAWKKAIETNDKFAPPFFNIARAYISDKQPAEAEPYIRRGLAIDPNNVDGLFLLATALGMQHDWQQAVTVAKKIHNYEHRHYADAHRIAGDALMQLNQYQEALAEYELYLQEDPENPRAAQVRQTMARVQARTP